MSQTRRIIDPSQYRNTLSLFKVPYTAFTTPRFDLTEYLEEIAYEDNSTPKFVHPEQQQQFWDACVEQSDARGWTMCIGGSGDVARADAVAAQLLGMYCSKGVAGTWVNLTSIKWYSDRVLKEILQPSLRPIPAVMVVSGLRWEGDAVRFDKAFDLLREAHPKCIRILTASGNNPIAFMRRLGLPVTRALQVRNYKEVQY